MSNLVLFRQHSFLEFWTGLLSDSYIIEGLQVNFATLLFKLHFKLADPVVTNVQFLIRS